MLKVYAAKRENKQGSLAEPKRGCTKLCAISISEQLVKIGFFFDAGISFV